MAFVINDIIGGSMKINFNIFKLGYNVNKKKKFSNISEQVISKKINEKVLPLVSLPLVAYYIGENEDQALKRLIKAMEEADIQIPSYKPDPSTKTGLDFPSQGKFRDAINKAAQEGKIDSTEKQELLNKVCFTGKDNSSYDVYNGNNDDDCCDCGSDDDSCDSDSDCCDSDSGSSDCDSGDAAVSSC